MGIKHTNNANAQAEHSAHQLMRGAHCPPPPINLAAMKYLQLFALLFTFTFTFPAHAQEEEAPDQSLAAEAEALEA